MTFRIKGVVVKIEGSKITIETNASKHRKLVHGRNDSAEYNYFSSKAPRSKDNRPWKEEHMPTKDTIVRVVFRKKV